MILNHFWWSVERTARTLAKVGRQRSTCRLVGEYSDQRSKSYDLGSDRNFES
jgi:hypothetical protein